MIEILCFFAGLVCGVLGYMGFRYWCFCSVLKQLQNAKPGELEALGWSPVSPPAQIQLDTVYPLDFYKENDLPVTSDLLHTDQGPVEVPIIPDIMGRQNHQVPLAQPDTSVEELARQDLDAQMPA